METKHTTRKPVDSRRAHGQRYKILALSVAAALGFAGSFALIMAGCGGGGTQPAPPVIPSVTPLSAADVDSIVQAAVNSVNVDMVVAVVDRAGIVLGVFHTAKTPTMAQGNFGKMTSADDVAVALARTGAFFSNDQAPLSSRTVRFISGVHFPPGIFNQSNADLYGIENTNRGCTLVSNNASYNALVPPSTALGGGPGAGILTGKADIFDSDPNAVNPGGVPVFSQATASTQPVVVGGVGVVTTVNTNLNVAEFAAFSGSAAKLGNGQGSFGLKSVPSPGAVFVGGIALPFVDQTSLPAGFSAGPVAGPAGSYRTGFGPKASLGQPPENNLIPPAAGPVGGLTVAEVTQILDNAEAEANLTRAAIRLPPGARTRMVIAVADLDGTLLGLRRMPDATVFSIDVAASKARNMIYFNSSVRTAADLNGVPIGTAVTNRTISFGAQPFFPPGIDGSDPAPQFLTPGPFFNLYTNDTSHPCSQGFQAPGANQSGIVFFPGSAGLYKNGVLVGGLGVSGDGVDQDDFVTAGGTKGFEAPDAIRADQVFVRSIRLPYMKFPRNPTN